MLFQPQQMQIMRDTKPAPRMHRDFYRFLSPHVHRFVRRPATALSLATSPPAHFPAAAAAAYGYMYCTPLRVAAGLDR